MTDIHIIPPITLEKELTEERDLLFSILASMGEGLFVVDRDCKIVLLNTLAQKMLGIKEGDVISKKFVDVVTLYKGEEAIAAEDRLITKVLKHGDTIITNVGDNYVYKSADGASIPVVISISPLKGEDLSGAVILFRDVTHEKNVDKVKTEFLSVAAHQLRTPLGVMRWNLELILNADLPTLATQKTHDTILQIYQSNQRMIKLVNDLLSVSRIDQERVMDRPSMTDLLKVVKDVIAELSIEAEKRHVTIELVEDPASMITPMMIDAGRFRDIMLNLIANGIKYNTKDGKVIVTFSSDGTVIKISVKDTGIGIPEKDKVRIFQKFFRAENAILNATEGSGLGLYLVKSYVEGWGGTVEFESELGKGALFTIKLPINKSQVAK